jgi:hypothetical protein
LQWVRYQDETAEKFSRRIANDLLAARGRPPLPKPLPSVEALQANAPPPPKFNHRNEPEHRGSKLADPSIPFPQHVRPHTPRAAHHKPQAKVAAE